MEYYSVKEISELLSVNEETVRRWIRKEKIEAERGTGRQGNKVSSTALKAFLENNKGLITGVAATTLMIGSIAPGLPAALSALSAGITSWLSILKDKDKDASTVQLELLEKQLELEAVVLNLKNEIANKQNELEMVEKQIEKIKEIRNEKAKE